MTTQRKIILEGEERPKEEVQPEKRVRLVCVNCKRIDEYVELEFKAKTCMCAGCGSRALDVYKAPKEVDNSRSIAEALERLQRSSGDLHTIQPSPMITSNPGYGNPTWVTYTDGVVTPVNDPNRVMGVVNHPVVTSHSVSITPEEFQAIQNGDQTPFVGYLEANFDNLEANLNSRIDATLDRAGLSPGRTTFTWTGAR